VLKIRDSGYTNSDALSTTVAMGEDALAKGTTAMMPGGDWLYSDFQANYPDQLGDIGLMPVNWSNDPSQLNVYIGVSGNGLYIPKSSTQIDAAQAFINFVMSPDVMKAMYDITPGISPVNGLTVSASAFDQELAGYATSGVAGKNYPISQVVVDESLKTTGGKMTTGDWAPVMNDLWSSTNVIKSLDDWYTAYAKVSKTAGAPGF